MKLHHWDQIKDGPLNEKKMTEKLESLGYAVARYTYPPGTLFPEHTHNIDKIDGVLAGRFKMTMEGQSVILEAGDYLEVPKGTVHRAEVMGSRSVISLDATK